MAVDMFLKLEGIEGESTDAAHAGESEIESFEWAATNKPTQARGGGRGAGKVEMHDVIIKKPVDKMTPQLAVTCATGAHIPEAVIAMRRAGGEQQEYMTITFKDVLVTSVSNNGGRDTDIPIETVQLNFVEVEWEYKPQKPDGTLDAPVKAGYNLGAAQKL